MTKFTTKKGMYSYYGKHGHGKYYPTYKRVVPTVIPNTLRLYAAGRPSQTSSFLSHQMVQPEKLKMLSLLPSTLPLVSARTERDVPYT